MVLMRCSFSILNFFFVTILFSLLILLELPLTLSLIFVGGFKGGSTSAEGSASAGSTELSAVSLVSNPPPRSCSKCWCCFFLFCYLLFLSFFESFHLGFVTV